MLKRLVNHQDHRQWYLMLIPIVLFLSNIKLFSLFGHGIRPMDFVMPICSIIFLVSNKKIHGVFGSLVFLLLPLFGLVNAIDKQGFVSSFAYYFIEVLFILAFIVNSNLILPMRKKKILLLSFRLMMLSVIFGLVQFLLANIFGSRMLYNCFGFFQYHKNYVNSMLGFVRACSIFYEPSVFGWMCVSFYGINELVDVGQNRILYRFVLLVGIAISLSASAILALFALAIIILFVDKKGRFFHFSLVMISIILLFATHVDASSLLRLDSVNMVGTSGYNRLSYPFEAAIQTINAYPLFGRGLGQIGVIDEKIQNYSEIFNSIFGIIVLFGASGILIYAFVIRYFAKWILVSKKTILLCFLIIYLLFSNGSFLTLDFPIVFAIFNIATTLLASNKFCCSKQLLSIQDFAY